MSILLRLHQRLVATIFLKTNQQKPLSNSRKNASALTRTPTRCLATKFQDYWLAIILAESTDIELSCNSEPNWSRQLFSMYSLPVSWILWFAYFLGYKNWIRLNKILMKLEQKQKSIHLVWFAHNCIFHFQPNRKLIIKLLS